jgi:hypothetical protein
VQCLNELVPRPAHAPDFDRRFVGVVGVVNLMAVLAAFAAHFLSSADHDVFFG